MQYIENEKNEKFQEEGTGLRFPLQTFFMERGLYIL